MNTNMRNQHRFQIVQDDAVAPVRRRQRLRWTRDENGDPVELPMEADSIEVGDSVDSTHIHADHFYHCGCPMEIPPGGKCAEGGCGRISCQRCAGRCARCQKPLCLEHSVYVLADNGTATGRFCRGCDGEIRRARRIRSVSRALLSPFVKFENR